MPIKKNRITNTNDKEFITRMMKESVEKCYKADLFVPALCLICCFIDGIGKGSKNDYLKNLKRFFPNLCKELGAAIFYQMYRNGLVHESSMKKGYAIGRNKDLKSKYVSNDFVEENKEKLIILNIDKLVDDFLTMINKKRKNYQYN